MTYHLDDTATVHIEEYLGFEIDIEVDLGNGARACTAVTIRQRAGGPDVTTEALRTIPVTRLIDWYDVVEYFHKTYPFIEELKELDREQAARAREAGPTQETLELVARIYRAALSVGSPPTKRVEEFLELPRSTAGRWVALARKQGHLGEAAGAGRAGEAAGSMTHTSAATGSATMTRAADPIEQKES